VSELNDIFHLASMKVLDDML